MYSGLWKKREEGRGLILQRSQLFEKQNKTQTVIQTWGLRGLKFPNPAGFMLKNPLVKVAPLLVGSLPTPNISGN